MNEEQHIQQMFGILLLGYYWAYPVCFRQYAELSSLKGSGRSLMEIGRHARDAEFKLWFLPRKEKGMIFCDRNQEIQKFWREPIIFDIHPNSSRAITSQIHA